MINTVKLKMIIFQVIIISRIFENFLFFEGPWTPEEDEKLNKLVVSQSPLEISPKYLYI